jgi:hypothetical protein
MKKLKIVSLIVLLVSFIGLVGCNGSENKVTLVKSQDTIFIGDKEYDALMAKNKDAWGHEATTVSLVESNARQLQCVQPQPPCRDCPQPPQQISYVQPPQNTHVVNNNNQGGAGWVNNMMPNAALGGGLVGAAAVLRPARISGGGGSSSSSSSSAAASSD